ncbi:MAG: 3-deoxy-D-manno-octulosonic acid transferase [Nitrospirae bacterium]|nr:3-deoxy-D-manno-octulosonic acid transferase [Nitrospirota bacterium]
MFLFYSLIYLLSVIILLPYEFLKRQRSLRRRWLKEKFGFIRINKQPSSIWLHAVSVGEVMASLPFIKALKEQYPRLYIVVSTVTDTGQKVASERLKGIAETIYIPFDISFCLRRALQSIKPILFIAVETEIWPNIFRVMRISEVPVAIVNGRISSASFRGYMRIRVFMKRVLENVDLFCMQEPEYAQRIIAIGAKKHAVSVTGNFKFDLKASSQRPLWANCIQGNAIIAGSTHKGEEDLVLSVFMALKKDFPNLNLILAPRHPERFNEVEDLIKSKGVSYLRRSRLSGFEGSSAVILLDTIGELFSAYSIADIAIIGGSFIKHGGQNPLEPAYWGKPVVCGPHMENFPFVEEFLKEGAIIRADELTLYRILKELLRDPEKRSAIGIRAKELCMEKTGAVQNTLKALERYLEKYGTI